MIEKIQERELHEECGVFGVYGVPNAASLTYYGLHALQHRGQEGAGIVAVDAGKNFRRIKGAGLVTEVFDEAKLASLRGSMAIGHVRYATTGGGGAENIQPFLFRHNSGDFALAHNGNIVNSQLLRESSRTREASSSRPPTARFWPTSSRRRPATTTVRASTRLSMR